MRFSQALSRILCAVCFAGMGAGIAGCAHAPANSGYSSFSSYAESVFRRQNELNSRLLMLNEADQIPDNEEFDSAESAFQDACELLNEYAERESSGDSVSLTFKQKVQDSVTRCEAGINRMEAVLNKFGKGL